MRSGPLPDWKPLPRSFYRRDALRVARSLLGKILVRKGPDGVAAARLVEVEAYRGPSDRAAHSWNGRRTRRNEVMWGPEGHLYVYFVYGMHWCANVVCAGAGEPEAVLLRGAEPLAGLERIRHRRGPKVKDEHLLRGPACLCKGLGLDGRDNGADLCTGGVFLAAGPAVPSRRVRRTPRVGVAYAGADAERPWRLFVAGSPAVSGPRPSS